MLSTLRIENSPFNEQQLKQLQISIGDLSPVQSQWLSGYLAGRLAGPLQTEGQPQSSPAVGEALSIIYATETGHSESIAHELAEGLQKQGINTELHAMDNFRPAALRKLKNVAFIISTHGEGDPPDESLSFFEYLESDRAPGFPELNYRVLALGDRSYQKFCEAGRRLDERLQFLGARPFGERLECDVDYTKEARAYSEEVIDFAREQLATESAAAGNESTVAHHLRLVPNEMQWSREQPFSAEVGQVQQITAEGSIKEVSHLELLLDNSNLHYQAGDALGVWAPNDPQLVEHLLEIFEIPAFVPVRIDDKELSITEALENHLEITRLTTNTVLNYATVSGQDGLATIFDGFNAEQQQGFIENRQLVDLAEEYPAQLDPQSLVEGLRPLAPRSYSIASSQQAVDEEVHLTVATLNSNANGTKRQGVASGLLNNRLKPGDKVKVFVEQNRRFRLPDDPQTPIIMIAAGTGIAPYRAFMQELESRTNAPDSWLIFGNPQMRTDFLYQREWLHWRNSGLLNRIDTAWSRDQAEKHYVQDVILEQAGNIDQWLQKGAYVYLCGALQMGQAVQQALQAVLAQQRGIGPDEAAILFAGLRRDGRIKKDLY
jgi:sulfite reductase (NADPH) flavoprotein alpha-component